MKEGRTKKEAIRCLKHYVVREGSPRSLGQISLLTVHRITPECGKRFGSLLQPTEKRRQAR